jgi:serine/threonine-protein kinase
LIAPLHHRIIARPMPVECPSCKVEVPDSARFCAQCGCEAITNSTHSTVRISHWLRPGTRLGAYEVGEVVGEGGAGTVYRGRDRVRERDVAIKVLHPSLTGDSEVRRRFVREARLMRTLSHPHIATVYDLVEDARFLAIVMEYVEGPTLTAELERWAGRVPYAAIRAIMTAVLDAMDAAHRHGVIHRDLKPDNVIVKWNGARAHPKVVDFGIAKLVDGTTYTVTGAFLGTCRYMSPEQLEAPHTLGYATDVYSLGVTLFELVTGRCPFAGDSNFATMMAHVRTSPPSPSSIRADVPELLEALILDALAKKPEDRPPTCEVFKERLLAAIDEPAAIADDAALPRTAREADGSELCLVSGGTFLMGPERRSVHVNSFYMDRFPVTNAQYATFLQATGYRTEEGPEFPAHFRAGAAPPGLASHPVVHVSWFDARAYAVWAGKRLPTEAEWEKSARGEDGRRYPWGKVDPDPSRANYGRHKASTVPVGSCPAGASPYGVEDLAGNVWEWCEDVDSPEFFLHGPTHNPCNRVRSQNAREGRRVVRGGSWMYDARSIRTYSRSSFEPGALSTGIGFRCAKDP